MRIIPPITIADADLTSSVAEDTSAAWNSGTTYAENDIIHLASTHRRYQSLIPSNTANNPATDDGTKWLDIGPTNRWAMFDTINSTATSDTDEIDVTIAATDRVDSVALLGLTAASVQIIAEYDASEVYNETYSLTDMGVISDWYEYFFSEITFATDLIVTDLPRYGNMDVQIIITGSGAVSCGTCIPGLARELGATVYGVRVGINDYSRKEADDFGNIIVVERPFSKRMEADVVIEGTTAREVSSKVDNIQRKLAQYRASPVVWQASEAYGSTAVFGYYRSFDIEIAYALRSNLTLSIEGLT